MKYKNEDANIRAQYPAALRKSIIIILLLITLISLTFVRSNVRQTLAVETQSIIDVEDVPITKQKLEQPKQQPKPEKIAEVVEAEEDETPDTIILAETEIKPDTEYVPPPIEETEIIPFYKLENPPKLVNENEVKIEYPSIARRAEQEGDVLIEVIVGTDGSVEEARVLQARPEGTFDEAALKAARQWKFEPAYQQDQPVKVRVQKPIKFRLK